MEDEIPSNFFLTEDYVLYTEKVLDFEQSFYALPSASTDYDLTGQVLWPGAKQLSEYLLSNQSLILNKVILEVGSGSGLCGLFCSQLASRTILSDGNEVVLNLLKKNQEFGKNIEIALVDWDCPSVSADLTRQSLPTKYEIIIGADVVYWSNSIIPLFNTIEALLEPEGKFLMCYTLRAMNIYRDLLKISLEKGFKNEVLWQNDASFIFEFKRVSY